MFCATLFFGDKQPAHRTKATTAGIEAALVNLLMNSSGPKGCRTEKLFEEEVKVIHWKKKTRLYFEQGGFSV
jgi:hypothetical protein